MKRITAVAVAMAALFSLAIAQQGLSQKAQGPDRDAFGPAQAAADIVRDATGADAALLPAGMMVREFTSGDLVNLIRFPGDTLVVSRITGEQLQSALERSVSTYPSPNSSFLQISGIDVTFDPNKPTGARIVSVTVNGSPIDAKTQYEVAMPISLARGGYGFFSQWDKSSIFKNFDDLTLKSLLTGKTDTDPNPRWHAVGQ